MPTSQKSQISLGSAYVTMSLEEEQLPPSTQGGAAQTQRRAWDGGSIESSLGTYNTTDDNQVSMQEISGGDDYWSREEGNTRSMEDVVQQLKEKLLAVTTEMMKYKHQLESQQTPDPCHDNGEVTRLESELLIAQQTIEELHQEVLLNKYLLEKHSPCPSMSDSTAPALNGGDHLKIQNGLQSARAELGLQQDGELDRAKGDLQRVKGELERVKVEQSSELERVNRELDEVKGERNALGHELDKVKVELSEVRGELRRELDKVRGDTRTELEQAKSELRSKEAELRNMRVEASSQLHTAEELERTLETTRKETDQVQLSLQDKELELDGARITLQNREEELERVKQELDEARITLQREEELERVKQELDEARITLQNREEELERVKQELDGARITLQYREEELERVKQELQSGKKTTPSKKRLDSQTLLKLEGAMRELDEKAKKCEQFDTHIQKVEEEKSILETDLKRKGEKLSETRQLLAVETHRRLELDSQWTRDKQAFQYELSEKSVTVSKLEEESEKYAKDLQRKEVIAEELKAAVETERTQLKVILEEKEQLASEKDQIASEKQRLASEKDKILSEKQQIASEKAEVVKQNTAMLARINRVEEDRKELHTRALTAEEACGGFVEEVEKTMEDYHKLTAQIDRLTEENGEIRQKRDKYFNQLSKRTEEAQKKGTELKSKDEELKRRNEELTRKDEELTNYGEKLKAQEEAAKLQMQLYEDDFATEREAREKTVAKLGNQHKVNGELRNRIESLERDKKELRAQLNQHAARQFQEEFAEEYSNEVYHPSSPRDAPQGHPIPRDPQRPPQGHPIPGPRDPQRPPQGPYRAS